jgi:cytohesin
MVRSGSIERVRILLQLGADINVLNQEGFTPLMAAAELGKDDVMIFLLQNGADMNVLNEKAGDLLCSLISGRDNEETLRILIEYGIDVNAKTSNDTPALFCLFNKGATMETGLRKNVQLLLDAGFDANATDEEGDTSLHYAVSTHCREKEDRFKLAKMLIDHGADVNKTNTKGETPLHIILNPYAGSSKSEELIRLMAENNTHLNDIDRYGCNTLHNAAICGLPNVVSLLASKGAVIENRNDESHGNQTPLFSAIQKSRIEVVKVLLDSGADLEARNIEDSTPLYEAVMLQNVEMVHLLLDYQPDCNVQCAMERTPLHQAVGGGNKEIVQLLLNAGARPGITDFRNRTPLELAKRRNESEIAAILEAAGN